VNYSRCNAETHLLKIRCGYIWTHNTLISAELAKCFSFILKSVHPRKNFFFQANTIRIVQRISSFRQTQSELYSITKYPGSSKLYNVSAWYFEAPKHPSIMNPSIWLKGVNKRLLK